MICYVNVVVSPAAGYGMLCKCRCYPLPQDKICYVNVVLSPTSQDMICYVNVVLSPTTGYDMLC